MNHNFVRHAVLSAAGVFILAASPLHSASLDPTVAFAGDEQAILRAPAAPAIAAPVAQILPQPEVSLEPGEFVWDPDAADRGQVEIVVSIPLQRVYVYRGGTL